MGKLTLSLSPTVFNLIINVSVLLVLHFITVIQEDPEFTDVIDNITVPAGRNVKLACSVKNLGSYKVSECGMVNGD